MAVHAPVPARYLERIEALLKAGGRRLLGLAGPPGGGKSTLADALKQHFGARVAIVPMDGFHLANSELLRLDRRARKGAPDTFDAAGFVALLRRLKTPFAGETTGETAAETVYAPEFRREIEEAVAGAIAVSPEVPLVVTEGNYLLLESPPWAEVRGLLDEAWYVAGDEALRLERLVRRHMQFGRSEQTARDWVAHTDEPNARLIEATRGRADLLFQWT